MNPAQRKKEFILELARFLSEDVAAKSILAEVHDKTPPPAPIPVLSKNWRRLYQLSGIRGYSTVAQTEAELTKLLA